MTAIIAKTRDLINDPASAPTPQFTDNQIQDALDERRRDVWLEELAVRPTILPQTGGNNVNWLDYYSDGGWWEDQTYTLQNYSYNAITTTSSPVAIASADLLVGHWTLTASQIPPVIITGRQFDLYAAAADLLEEWLASVKLQFDFLGAGRSFKRFQQIEGLTTLIERYRRRQRLGISTQVRTDMNIPPDQYFW